MTRTVAFLNTTGDKTGGAEESLALLVTNLPPDIKPLVILFEAGEYERRFVRSGIDVVVFEPSKRLMTTRRDGALLRGALDVPSDMLRLAQLLKARHVDLVHTHTVKAHLLGAGAAKLAGIPAVIHLRDIVEGRGKLLIRALVATCAKNTICVSRSVADWYPLRAGHVIYNPVDLSRYADVPSRVDARAKLGLPQHATIVGMVGRINRWKGHDRFLNILARVRERDDVHGVIVGEARFRDADFVPELKEQMKRLGLDGHLTFVPWVDDPRLAYAALDVHCNCSTREPFGRTIVEAAACGVPSIAFDDGGGREIIEDGVTGFVIASHDESAYADALAGLLEDPARLTRMRAAALQSAGRYSIDAHVRDVVAVLRASMQRGRVVPPPAPFHTAAAAATHGRVDDDSRETRGAQRL